MKTATKVGIAIVGILAAAVVARAATFDPDAWATDVRAKMSPFASNDLAAFEKMFGELRTRFHVGDLECARYGPSPKMSPERADEIANAIIDAGLATDLDGAMRTSMEWTIAADDKVHHASEPAEVLSFFSERASLWERTGLFFRGGAAEAALEKQRPAFVRKNKLPAEKEARVKALWDRYGGIPIMAVMRVSNRKSHVDLSANELHLLAPGMTRAEAHRRLGDGVVDGDEERWPTDDVSVLYDTSGTILAVTTSAVTQLYDGDKIVIEETERQLVERLGKPTWTGNDDEMREVVYERGGARLRLLFAARLKRVELWKRESLTPR